MSRQSRIVVPLKLGLRSAPGRGRNLGALAVSAAALAAAACTLQLRSDISGSVGIGPSPVGFDGGPTATTPFTPTFRPTTTASVPPPAISGGTLLALGDGNTAAMSDPDRDSVSIVNTQTATLTYTIALNAGDEPGRLVQDGAGRVHVALRSGGALVTVDPKLGTVLERRTVCPAPRGVAWESATDLVWVACATGELVALPAAGGPAVTSLVLERDLRDIVIDNGTLSVTKFRSAQVLRLASDHTIARRDTMPAGDISTSPTFQPHVLWRSVQGPGHTTVSVHQEHSTTTIPTHVQGGYGGGGDGAQSQPNVVGSRCSVVGADGTVVTSVDIQAVLPVDVAVSPDGSYAVVAAAGDAFSVSLNGLTIVPMNSPAGPQGTPPSSGSTQSVATVFAGAIDAGPSFAGLAGPGVPSGISMVSGQAVAVAFDASNHLLVQTREPAQLVVMSLPSAASTTGTIDAISSVTLSSVSRDDTGHDVFHTAAGSLVACASCHPEGGDDGHVWQLDGNARRTPSLRGTIAGTAPYHWPGDQADFVTLANDVYTRRMSGAVLDSSQMTALNAWVEAIPPPAAPSWVDPAAATRGRAIFERGDVGCSTCHSGPKFTNNQTVNVGTGQAFQVPPLIGVGWRTPLLHDGCAATIGERFTLCSTAGHGVTSTLGPQGRSDLTAYLETL